ncbi:MAG: hypothetical protein KBE22_13850 [Candidatus Accumulibacter sp.]|nr:hypothetical protein [Accumulibacter sp.]
MINTIIFHNDENVLFADAATSLSFSSGHFTFVRFDTLHAVEPMVEHD